MRIARIALSTVAFKVTAFGAVALALVLGAAPAIGQQVITVAKNEYLSTIARQIRPDGATLNQTLVALYEANPKAFIQSNLNLVYAGARLTVPDAAVVASKTPAQATQIVAEHNARFAAWRQRLAARAAPAKPTAGAVPDASPMPPAPKGDRLELSQAAVEERQIAQAEVARQQALQAEAMTRNLTDLKDVQRRLAQMPAPIQAPASAPAAVAVSQTPLAKPDPYSQWPAWVRNVKDHPALLPSVVVALLLLALWAWAHERNLAAARQSALVGSSLGPWVEGIDLDFNRDNAEGDPSSLSDAAAHADIDDAVPHYLSGSADGDLEAADALANAGNPERARELAEQALADPSADVRARARVLLDRIGKDNA